MQRVETFTHNFGTIGEGALLIWWGLVLMIDPLTIGIGAIGTGMIMLGVNLARRLNGIPTKPYTTIFGSIALVWGILDTIFAPSLENSFAFLLIIIGVATMGTLLIRSYTKD